MVNAPLSDEMIHYIKFVMKSYTTTWIDRSAMSLSGLCLVHCLAGSVLLALLSVSGGILSHWVHSVGLALAVPLAAFGLWRGVAQHGQFSVAIFGFCGLALMSASLFVAHGDNLEIATSITGVSLLGLGHWINLRLLNA